MADSTTAKKVTRPASSFARPYGLAWVSVTEDFHVLGVNKFNPVCRKRRSAAVSETVISDALFGIQRYDLAVVSVAFALLLHHHRLEVRTRAGPPETQVLNQAGVVLAFRARRGCFQNDRWNL